MEKRLKLHNNCRGIDSGVAVCRRDRVSAILGVMPSFYFHRRRFVLSRHRLPVNRVRSAILYEPNPAPDEEDNGAEEESYECEIEDKYVVHVTTFANQYRLSVCWLQLPRTNEEPGLKPPPLRA